VTETAASHRAQELRHTFDQMFARAPDVRAVQLQDLLGITIAGVSYALDLTAVTSLHAGKPISRVPGARGGLLGIAGFRGMILPVYDLAALLDLPAVEKPRWLAVVGEAGVAVAFEKFDGHLRVEDGAVVPNDVGEGARRHVRHLLQEPRGIRAVINLSSALARVVENEI